MAGVAGPARAEELVRIGVAAPRDTDESASKSAPAGDRVDDLCERHRPELDPHPDRAEVLHDLDTGRVAPRIVRGGERERERDVALVANAGAVVVLPVGRVEERLGRGAAARVTRAVLHVCPGRLGRDLVGEVPRPSTAVGGCGRGRSRSRWPGARRDNSVGPQVERGEVACREAVEAHVLQRSRAARRSASGRRQTTSPRAARRGPRTVAEANHLVEVGACARSHAVSHPSGSAPPAVRRPRSRGTARADRPRVERLARGFRGGGTARAGAREAARSCCRRTVCRRRGREAHKPSSQFRATPRNASGYGRRRPRPEEADGVQDVVRRHVGAVVPERVGPDVGSRPCPGRRYGRPTRGRRRSCRRGRTGEPAERVARRLIDARRGDDGVEYCGTPATPRRIAAVRGERGAVATASTMAAGSSPRGARARRRRFLVAPVNSPGCERLRAR